MINNYCIIVEVRQYREKFYRRTFFIVVIFPAGVFKKKLSTITPATFFNFLHSKIHFFMHFGMKKMF